MSSFFTLPASQRKRKRTEPSHGSKPRQQEKTSQRPTKRRETRDESISGSDLEDEELEESSKTLGAESSDSEESDEDAAGKRTRLAERYLENTRQQVLAEGDGFFDAKDIDNDLLAERMGERLKEDTAESKGKLYRWIADDYDYGNARHAQFRANTDTMTGVAICYPCVYTVSRDMTLIKWQFPDHAQTHGTATHSDYAQKPKQVVYTKGNGKKAFDPDYQHHTSSILCVAASGDGKFVATGGQDKKLIVWDAKDLKPLRVFHHHRDAVMSLCFRRGTNQLFSASKDRTVKIWSMDELAYVETLYGHQDEVLDVAALSQEKCVTVGARDRTARYWRVVEESQLVFRGGGASSRHKKDEDGPQIKSYNEGSMDRIAMVDDEMFVTGSDNGTISLWNIQKKKAIHNYPLAHGLQPPIELEEASAETHPTQAAIPEPQPRYITALASLPFSNIVVSGSWDGEIRGWKISEDKRRLEPLGPIGSGEDKSLTMVNGNTNEMDGLQGGSVGSAGEASPEARTVRGIVNDLAIFEKGENGKGGLSVVAAMGKQHRLGNWLKAQGKNYAMVFDLPIKAKV